MPALAGVELLKKFSETSAEKCRFIPKNGGDPIKAQLVEVFFGKHKHNKGEGVTLIPEDGASAGKTIFVSVERLKGMPGRPYGFSPAKKNDSPEESPAATPAKRGTAKKAETKTEKKVEKNNEDETFDLESAREELKEVVEILQDLTERASALASFMENLEMGQDAEEENAEEEEEEKPAPKAKAGKGKTTRSAKPRHEDSDED